MVTGASSGIGAATARGLAAAGFRVVCAARRADRVHALAAEIGGTPVVCDVTDAVQVDALAEAAGPAVHVLVNNAGGALGQEPIEQTDPEAWRSMYDSNVLGTLRVTQALLPALVASTDGVLINIGSIAGHLSYEGGAGYVAAKHGVAVIGETLRLELVGRPVRVCEVAPGMVQTEEFSLVRFGGDAQKAAQVYAGVDQPLVAADVANAVVWVATRPSHVNIDLMVIKPRAQAAPHKFARD